MLALATYRITYMLVEEDGPFNMFKALRKFFGQTTIEDENGFEELVYFVPQDDWFLDFGGGVLSCFYCCSMYAAFLVLLISLIPILSFVLYPFALSALAIIVYQKFT